MVRSICLIVFISISGLSSVSALQSIPLDTSSDIEVRIPESNAIEAYQNDEDFNYDSEAERSESWLALLLMWVLQLFGKVFGNTYGILSLRLLLILLFIIAAGLLLNAFFKGNLAPAFTSTSSSKKLKVNLKNDHIDSIDIDLLMKEAIDQKNFRLAARYLYIKALQNLNDSNIITWANDKTNHEYLTEIGHHPSKESFSKLTLIHDYTEYGDFEIDQAGFQKMTTHYQKMITKLELSS